MSGESAAAVKVHLLDLGHFEYGDGVLLELGETRVLIDGGHPGSFNSDPAREYRSIPEQLDELLGGERPHRIDLLVITHAHQDHIGCIPSLVAEDVIRVRWALVADHDLGWGLPIRDTDAADRLDNGASPAGEPDPELTALVNRYVAALREEPLTRRRRQAGEAEQAEQAEQLRQFVTAADALIDTYGNLLAALRDRGTEVVEFGRDAIDPIEEQFAGVGLRVLGPSEDQLILASEAIITGVQHVRRLVHDFLSRPAADTAVLRRDAAAPEFYWTLRDLTNPAAAPTDTSESTGAAGAAAPADPARVSLDAAQKRLGSAINLQSLVLKFEFGGVRLLMAGDMELARPEGATALMRAELRALREVIRGAGPYDLVKLLHHGSKTAADAELLDRDLAGTTSFGISTGSKPGALPDTETLALLRNRRERITWARTDRNGRTTFTFGPPRPQIERSRGQLNDSSANEDTALVAPAVPEPRETRPTEPGAGGGAAESLERRQSAAAGGATEAPAAFVEVTAKVPHVRTRVTLTIDVEPGGAAGQAPARVDSPDPVPTPPVPRPLQNLRVAGGRRPPELPRLLFVTSREALVDSIGAAECAQVLQEIRDTGQPLLDTLPARLTQARQAAPLVRAELARLGVRAEGAAGGVEGVVILGGYHVVPAQRLDALPPRLRDVVSPDDDPDGYYVWSDDVYGQTDEDELPELPVSRIPDGMTKELVETALSAAPPRDPPRHGGVRNAARPFAKTIFAGVQGTLLESEPEPGQHAQVSPDSLTAEHLYLMLHGSLMDATRFYGEGGTRLLEAVNMRSVPARFPGVVFSGCCWGALPVNRSARYVGANDEPAPRGPRNSLALAFLAAGARAFVGCTGVHYSPLRPPWDEGGGMLHKAFWKHLREGHPPARALFNAKSDYVQFMLRPGRRSPVDEAVEYKTWRQFTCLGLGW